MKIQTAWRVARVAFFTGAFAPILLAILLLWLALGCTPEMRITCNAPRQARVQPIIYVDTGGTIMRTDSMWWCE